jgi:CTP:molybdopterin cytidylyltransferase MocA
MSSAAIDVRSRIVAERRGAVAGVVLAAGAGRRLGQPKALVRLGGELLVERAIRTATQGSCDPVIVVLGSHAEQVLAAAQLEPAHQTVAANWSEGMGASLRAGIDAATALDCVAIAVILVDQPRIGAEALRRLITAWQAGALAAVATYDGQPRNPVVLDRSIWSAVSDAAHGDIGARGWLRAHPDEVAGVDCDGTGDPVDIDTPHDLETLQEAP